MSGLVDLDASSASNGELNEAPPPPRKKKNYTISRKNQTAERTKEQLWRIAAEKAKILGAKISIKMDYTCSTRQGEHKIHAWCLADGDNFETGNSEEAPPNQMAAPRQLHPSVTVRRVYRPPNWAGIEHLLDPVPQQEGPVEGLSNLCGECDILFNSNEDKECRQTKCGWVWCDEEECGVGAHFSCAGVPSTSDGKWTKSAIRRTQWFCKAQKH